MRICSACGHALTSDGPCGFASITVGEKTTYLCHADDHSCYMAWRPTTTSATSRYLALPDAAEGTGETDSHDDPGEASPGNDAVRALLESWEGPDGWTAIEGRLSYDVGYKRSWRERTDELRAAVRDLTAPSNVSVSSRPSPGADPRIEAILDADYPVNAERILAIADAADRERHIVRVDTRDEAVQRAVYEHIAARYTVDIRLDTILRNHIRLVFAALAALRGGQ